MALSIDFFLYLAAAVLFFLAGFNVSVTVGSNPPKQVAFEWLAFCVLTVSLIV